MRKIWNKGHRIRASDKHLVYHFSIGTLLFVFVAVLLLLNIKQLMRTDWEHFSLFENGLTLSPYNFITILISTGVCALVAFLYYRFCYDSFKKLLHRQKLARMVLENKWYEADTVQDSGFFTDLQSRSREKIVWFPKIYYQMEKGLLHIRCEITLGKYQDQLLRLEDKLESGLYCELTDKTLHDGYIEYTLLYDMIANRITIDEVRAENGCLTQSDSRGLLHVIDELRREDTPISRNIADHIDSFTDYDFAHLLFSDGTVENAISLDNQLNIIQVADLVLPDKDTTFEEYTTIELLSVSMLIVISTFALDFIHSDRSIFKIVDLDEAWAFLNVAQGETLSNKLVRAGRAMQAGVYFVTQSSGDVAKESLKNNIGLKFAFRSTDINEIKQTLEFFGIDKDDENNQKRLRDLEKEKQLSISMT